MRAIPSGALNASVGLNTRACQGSPTFPLPPAPTTEAALTRVPWVAAILGGTDANGTKWPGLPGVTLLRDGGTGAASGCDAARFGDFVSFANVTHARHGWRFMQNFAGCDAGLAGLEDGTTYDAGVTFAAEYQNEWDSARPYFRLASPAAAGATTLALPPDLARSLTSGQTYEIDEGPSRETIVVASCGDLSHAILAHPTARAHAAIGATVLTAPADAGATTLAVASSAPFAVGQWLTLDCTSMTGHSPVRVAAVGAATLRLAPPGVLVPAAVGALVAGSCIKRLHDYASDVVIGTRHAAAVLAAATAAPALAGASLARPARARDVGPGQIGYVQYGNDHTYPEGRNPEGPDGSGETGNAAALASSGCRQSASSVVGGGCLASRATGDAPRIIGETGWPSIPPGLPAIRGQYDLPEDVVTAYVSRMYLFNLALGIPYTFYYSFVDTSGCDAQFDNYGLVGVSGTHVGAGCHALAPYPKGSYRMLASILALTQDRGATARAASTAEIALTMTQPATGPRADDVLLETPDGTLLLFAWLGGQTYDTNATGPCTLTLACRLIVPPQRVTFAFASPPAFAARPRAYTWDTAISDCTYGNAAYARCGARIDAPPPILARAPGATTWSPTLTTTPLVLVWRRARDAP